jgi:hypothetical protein
LLLIVALARRVWRPWGLTDFLLLGAAIGAVFGFLEAMLRFSWRADRAIPDGSGGFVLAISLAPPHILGIGPMLTRWLPPPVGAIDFFGTAGTGVNLHLVYTALAGFGLGVLSR